MKVLISEYGKTVLAVGIALLLLGLFLGSESGSKLGIWSRIKEAAEQEGAAAVVRTENILHQKGRQRKEPVIFYQGKSIRAGTEIDFNQLFRAVDQDGKTLEAKVLEVNGKAADGQKYRFPVSGIYEVKVWTKDAYGLSTNAIFQIPVHHLPFGREKQG